MREDIISQGVLSNHKKILFNYVLSKKHFIGIENCRCILCVQFISSGKLLSKIFTTLTNVYNRSLRGYSVLKLIENVGRSTTQPTKMGSIHLISLPLPNILMHFITTQLLSNS